MPPTYMAPRNKIPVTEFMLKDTGSIKAIPVVADRPGTAPKITPNKTPPMIIARFDI